MTISQATCSHCLSSDITTLPTYKRHWFLCNGCGTAAPQQRKFYPFSFLPSSTFKKDRDASEESMYDYFTDPVHIACSEEEAQCFLSQHIDAHGIDLNGKRILDISGGNGHVAKRFAERGADVTLTELNSKAIDYARRTLGLKAEKFDFNKNHIDQVVSGPFDIVMLRAAIMFCNNWKGFLSDIKKMIAKDGLMIINHAVWPTLGVLVRVQLDEHSYLQLRSPEVIIKTAEEEGFSLVNQEDETDPSMYVYDHDLTGPSLFLHYWYEIKGAMRLRTCRDHGFSARDRRRSTLILRKN